MRGLGASALALILAAAGAADAASRPAVEAEHAMIVSEQHYATEAGLEVLRQGGNAVDAAVAVGYALAVTHPCCGNIGGGGFMLIHLADGTEKFIDFRETAPGAATPDMYLDAAGNPVREASIRGWKASAIPGSVAGFELAEQSFGKAGRAKAMAPAIKLARDGYVLTRGDTDIIDYVKGRLAKDPEAAKIFLKPDGSTWQPGETLKQKDLAATLEKISKQGRDAFYKGAVAEAVAKASAAGGGLLTAADLAGYQAQMTEPLHCTYRGLTVSTAAPPSSGGIGVCEMREPPGLPSTRNTLPSLLTMVGAIEESGRLPGAMALRAPCSSPNILAVPGLAVKSSISSLRKKPVPGAITAAPMKPFSVKVTATALPCASITE